MMLEIGPGRWAHASGALWLPAERTALIADLHLGYGWAQRRRGELGALQDETVPVRLNAVLEDLRPNRVVLLGDIVHAPRPSGPERELVVKALQVIAASAELVLVRGNHDRGFERDFAVQLVESWESRSLLAVHGDVLPVTTRHLVAGHWHPAYTIVDAAGVKHSLPVFAAGQRLTILPAFSPFAAGLNLRKGIPPEWKTMAGGRVQLYAATGNQVAPIGAKQL